MRTTWYNKHILILFANISGCTADGLPLGFSQSVLHLVPFLPWFLPSGCKDFACAVEVCIDMATNLPRHGHHPGLVVQGCYSGQVVEHSAQHINVYTGICKHTDIHRTYMYSHVQFTYIYMIPYDCICRYAIACVCWEIPRSLYHQYRTTWSQHRCSENSKGNRGRFHLCKPARTKISHLPARQNHSDTKI